MDAVAVTLTPKQVLRAFNEARILITMTEYQAGSRSPTRSYWGQPFFILSQQGVVEESEPIARVIREPGEDDQALGLRVMHQYFQQLIALAPSRHVEIEWRTWPEIVIVGHECRAYSRLALRAI